MLEKDLVYELIKDKDKVCENYILCVFLEKLNPSNKDSYGVFTLNPILIVDNYSQGTGGFKLPNSFYIISQWQNIMAVLSTLASKIHTDVFCLFCLAEIK